MRPVRPSLVFFFVLVLLTALFAQDTGSYWDRWNTATKAGDWAAAERAMREGLARFPDNADFAASRAWALRNLKRPAEAVALLEPLLAKRPEEKRLREALAWALLDIGWQYFGRGDYTNSLVPFGKAHALLPDDRHVLNAYGCGLRDSGRIDEALPLLEKGYKTWPDDKYLKPNLQYAWIIKANLLAAASNFSGAESFYARTAVLDRHSETYLLQYGIYLNGRKRHTEALVLFEECGRRYPANKWVRGNIQYALQEQARQLASGGDTAGALRLAEDAVIRFPREVWFINDCVEWSLKLQRYERAEYWLHNLATGPLLNYAKPYDKPRWELVIHRMNSLLSKYAEQRAFARGFALLDRMGRAFPGALFVDEARGNLLFHSGRKEEGVALVNRVYDRYIRDNPQHAAPLLLELPLRGILTAWGNNRTDSITHAGMNRFCFDFLGADEAGNLRKPGTVHPGQNGDYYGFGREVLSVCDGVVEHVENRHPDIAPRGYAALGDGNSITVRDARGYHYCYVHNRQGSAVVRVGQTVKTGQKLAALGNTGYTSLPHLHIGVYSPDWRVTIPVRFRSYRSKDKSGTWHDVANGVPETGEIIAR